MVVGSDEESKRGTERAGQRKSSIKRGEQLFFTRSRCSHSLGISRGSWYVSPFFYLNFLHDDIPLEAHPEKFNSRLRNKMFYGQMGGKDLLKRKWKGLAEFVTLECDGRDLTPKLRELKVHAIVFLNIPRLVYA